MRHIAKRLGIGFATLLAVSVLIFGGVEAMPGDAATAALGQRATPSLLEQTREEFGLDRPLPARYLSWLSGLLRGDLGESLPSKAPVWDLIKDKLRNTAVLTLATMFLLIPLAMALGVLSALWRDRAFDHVASTTTLALTATPEFVVATLLIPIFALGLGILPAVSLISAQQPILGQLEFVVLPCLTLLLVAVAQATRMIRATTIQVLQSDYVRMAVLRGTPTWTLLRRHVLPNALGPAIQVLALMVGILMGGVVVTEAVFEYPGIGLTLIDAVQNRDLPTVVTISVIVSAVYVTVNIIADILIIVMNPRLRRARA